MNTPPGMERWWYFNDLIDNGDAKLVAPAAEGGSYCVTRIRLYAYGGTPGDPVLWGLAGTNVIATMVLAAPGGVAGQPTSASYDFDPPVASPRSGALIIGAHSTTDMRITAHVVGYITPQE